MTKAFLDDLLTMHQWRRKGLVPKKYGPLQRDVAKAAKQIDSLSEPERSILRARYCEGMTWQEVANSVGSTLDVVKRLGLGAIRQLTDITAITTLHLRLIDERIPHSFALHATHAELDCGKFYAVQYYGIDGMDVSGVLTSEELEVDTVLYNVSAADAYRRIMQDQE